MRKSVLLGLIAGIQFFSFLGMPSKGLSAGPEALLEIPDPFYVNNLQTVRVHANADLRNLIAGKSHRSGTLLEILLPGRSNPSTFSEGRWPFLGAVPLPHHSFLLNADHNVEGTLARAVVLVGTRRFETAWQNISFCPGSGCPGGAQVTGKMVKWHPLQACFTHTRSHGQFDSAPNPFLDYRLTVAFTSPSGKIRLVPGFFHGENLFCVRMSPDEPGLWTYRAQFVSGADIAVDLDLSHGTPASFDGEQGSFPIAPRDTAAPGFLSAGRLEYVGEHYLKFREGRYFVKGGPDSPENWLGSSAFERTTHHGLGNLHFFYPHEQDFLPGYDPFFYGLQGNSRGLIGALNYLSSQGMNVIYFLPMNAGGDARDTWPFADPFPQFNPSGSTANDNLHFDLYKLDQWRVFLEHAQEKGIVAHVVLNEAERLNKQELDGGELGIERKLFYREMVARLGYLLGLIWNISEEYDLDFNLGSERVKAFARYIRNLDPDDHPVAVHNYSKSGLDAFLGAAEIDVLSYQDGGGTANFGADLERFRQVSAQRGRPQVANFDEPASPEDVSGVDGYRKKVLGPAYFSGASGLEVFLRGEDQSLENFRSYESIWRYVRNLTRFFEENLPFAQMQPMDNLLSGENGSDAGGQVLQKPGEVYSVYLPNASPSGSLQVVSGTYEKRWYNPRSGQFEGSTETLSGSAISLGTPPSASSEDWVILLKRL